MQQVERDAPFFAVWILTEIATSQKDNTPERLTHVFSLVGTLCARIYLMSLVRAEPATEARRNRCLVHIAVR